MTADPTHRYAVGDPDPTWPDAEGARACPALDADARYACTWPAGHAHPQHIAGDGETVLGVWDATPPDASTCQRCAQPAGDRPTITLEAGVWMHYDPCWIEWDDMAAGAYPDPAEPTVAAEHDADQRPGDRLPPRPRGVITDDTDVPETVKLRPIDDVPLPEPADDGWVTEYAVRVEWKDGRDWTSEPYTRADAERAAQAFRPVPAASSIDAVTILTRRTRTEATPWQPVTDAASESPQEPPTA